MQWWISRHSSNGSSKRINVMEAGQVGQPLYILKEFQEVLQCQ
jgi:hypothetical protein